jgi:hypothetical protein
MTKVEVKAKEAEANAAKERFMGTLHTLQYRLSPKTIANDVKESVKEKASDAANAGLNVANQGVATARARPAAAAALAVPLVIFLLRKPIARVLSRLFDRSDAGEPATTDELTPYEAARVSPAANPETSPAGHASALADQGA